MIIVFTTALNTYDNAKSFIIFKQRIDVLEKLIMQILSVQKQLDPGNACSQIP